MCQKISNAFENVPFGDEMYGLLGSVPAKMLNVSGTGLQNTCLVVLIV
jgi:hypothetical protein